MNLIDQVITWEIKLEESNVESADYFLFDLKDTRPLFFANILTFLNYVKNENLF